MRGVACVLAAAVAVAATGCTRDEKQSAVPADAVASTSSSAASSPTTSSSAPIPTASPKLHSTPSRSRQSPGQRRTASTSPRQGATPARPKKLTSPARGGGRATAGSSSSVSCQPSSCCSTLCD